MNIPLVFFCESFQSCDTGELLLFLEQFLAAFAVLYSDTKRFTFLAYYSSQLIVVTHRIVTFLVVKCKRTILVRYQLTSEKNLRF
jgi:hypothetical protein